MRPTLFTTLLSFDDALAALARAVRPIERHETLPLEQSAGRVAAAEALAPADVPAFDRAAMDGYAVRAADVSDASDAHPVSVRCVSRIFTGDTSDRAIERGECAEIATGAPIPPGADAVAMVEYTTRDDDRIVVSRATEAGQNVGRRGSDLRADAPIVHPGDGLSPARVGALAAAGFTDVDVFARPRVAILSTGNEVTPPGRPLPPGHVYDVNRFTLQAVVARHGGEPVMGARVGDLVSDLRRALEEASTRDLIVCSGGSSVGGRDLLVDAVQALGAIVFHGLAVRPGKPTLFGRIGQTPIFGMPGNPTSCLSNAYLLLVPFLRATARLAPWRPTRLTLPLARAIRSPSDRHQFFTVRIAADTVEPAFKSSGDITSMAGADGYIEIPAGVSDVPAGSPVVVTLF